MVAQVLQSIRTLRNFLFKLVNKEFLIFLFFLLLSGSFWLFTTLNQTFEKEFEIPLHLTGIPKNVVVTTSTEDTVKVVVRDKGYMIAAYATSAHFRTINLLFKNYSDGKGKGVIPVADVQKAVVSQLYGTSKIVSLKADHLEFYFNLGQHKKVPVKLLGTIKPTLTHYLSHTVFTPDSVDVYASKEILDSIRIVYTERQHITDISEPTDIKVKLRKIKGVKFVPNQVTAHVFPDVLTEETVEVPIEAINIPADKILRTFPSKVTVSFVVGGNMLKKMPKDPRTKHLLPKGFRVVANYNEVAAKDKDKCRIYVQSSPNGVRNARPVISSVDYLIEQR